MSASLQLEKIRKPALWFLLFGILIRLLALNQPLVSAHLFRQCQTALITRGLMEQPGWHVGAVATWRGDLPAQLVLELPVYNYLVMPVYKITGNLDVSGKLVSVGLWVLGFLLLQRIWRRCLTSQQAFWANLMFVLAPLSVFYGQAFMPEMLIQAVAFGFLVALLRYQEQPATGRFLLAAGIGLLGMLVKGPEIAHLYLIAGAMVFKKEGLRALRKPSYWLAAILTVVVLKGWSQVIDGANTQYFPEWTSHSVLSDFIGSFRSHFNLGGYIKIALYLTCFVLTPVGALFVCGGIWRLGRTRPVEFPAWWVLSVVFFFVFWSGPVARGQSYYNLPALGPCALLFGLGVDAFLERRPASSRRWAAVLMLAIIPLLAGGSWYLFRADRVVLESARWIREHTEPGDLILLKANHRNDAVTYSALAPFPYYGERRFWVYSSSFRPEEMQRALATSKYALVTFPPPEGTSKLDAWRRRIKGESHATENVDSVLETAGFRAVHTNAQFMVYFKSSGGGTNEGSPAP